MTAVPCPCGSGVRYARCCRGIVKGEVEARTAEALMRSRYTAYARGDAAHLLRTWHPSTRPASLTLDDAVWLGLDVQRVEKGGVADESGTVTFAATYQQVDGTVATMGETSRFVREGDVWVYVDGDVL